MPKKFKTKQVQSDKRQALIDALAANRLFQQHREALLADEFMGGCLRIFEIYKSIGAPYVTASSEQGLSFDMEFTAHWLSHPLCTIPKGSIRPAVLPSFLTTDFPTFMQHRVSAWQSTERIIASWEKAGIPANEVWSVLQRIDPSKKRTVELLSSHHDLWVSLVKSHREACLHLLHLTSPETAFAIFSHELLSAIGKAAVQGVEMCSKALTALEEGSRLVKEIKKKFLHKHSPLQAEVRQQLIRLRRKYVKEETPTDTSHRLEKLLNTWAPNEADPWKAANIRPYVYKK